MSSLSPSPLPPPLHPPPPPPAPFALPPRPLNSPFFSPFTLGVSEIRFLYFFFPILFVFFLNNGLVALGSVGIVVITLMGLAGFIRIVVMAKMRIQGERMDNEPNENGHDIEMDDENDRGIPGNVDGVDVDVQSLIRQFRSYRQGIQSQQNNNPNSNTAMRVALTMMERELTPNDYDLLLQLDETQRRGTGRESNHSDTHHGHGHNSKGMTQNQIERLPTFKHTATGASSSSSSATHGETDTSSSSFCCICQEEKVVGDVLRCLPCLHSFHQQCADKWLAIKAECPECKYDCRQDIQ